MSWVGPGSFGHPGSGGSVGFADPYADVGFSYVTHLWSFRIGEPRTSDLAAAVFDVMSIFFLHFHRGAITISKKNASTPI
jgi:hypothetical protein